MYTMNEKIKAYRKENGWTQAYMAQRLGITQSAYCQIEKGDTESMRVSTLKKLCEEFDVNANWLLGLEDNNSVEYVKKVQETRNRIMQIEKEKGD